MLADLSRVYDCFSSALSDNKFLISGVNSLSGEYIVVVKQSIDIMLKYTFRVNFKAHFFIHFGNPVVVQLMHLLPIKLKAVHNDFH